MKKFVEAAKLAHAHSFIKRLPQGYDTPIAEDGGNLSQGQRPAFVHCAHYAYPPQNADTG